MKAMVLDKICNMMENKRPLSLKDLPVPVSKEKEVLVKVAASGVCHTELDEIEGRTPPLQLPVIPGHQIVGRVVDTGKEVKKRKIGDRVGIAWIYSACGVCTFCLNGVENLCYHFTATGRDVNGGYAEYVTVSEDFTYAIPDMFTDAEAAPLLCAGAIGYRSLKLANANDGENIGLTGFGASAHIVLKMIRYTFPNAKVFVFARSEKERIFAKELGAVWTGDTVDMAPVKLHCVIDTTPVWKPVVEALRNLENGGRLVINAIRKEDADKEYLMQLEYHSHLWLEKEMKTVANITRSDIEEFLKLAAKIPLKPEIQEFSLKEANKALIELKERKIRGSKVLRLD